MEVKEAIEFVREIKHSGNGYGNSYISDFNKLKDIISLLQQGEEYKKQYKKGENDFRTLVLQYDKLFKKNQINKKYRQIVEYLEKNCGYYYWGSCDNLYSLIPRLEQKYFPKGV